MALADDFNSYTDGNTLDSESADWAVWAASGTGVMTLDQHDDHSDLSLVVDMSTTGDNWAIHQTQVGGNDHYAEVDVFLDSLDEANSSLTAVAGPVVRGSQPNMGDSDFDGYAAFLERDDNGLGTATVILRIYRIDNDSATLLASSSDVAGQSYDASSTTATVRLEIEGDTLTAYADGNELVSTTDSTHGTGQHCGMRLNRVLSALNGQPFVDNFAGDVLAGGGTTFGRVTGTVTVRAFAAAKAQQIGRVTETGTTRTLAANKALVLGRVTGTGQVRAFSATKTRDLARVTGTGTARSFGSTTEIGRVTETGTSRSLTGSKARELGRVTGTGTVRTFGTAKAKQVGRITDSGTVRSFNLEGDTTLGRVAETGAVRSFTADKALAIGRVTETGDARQLVRIVGFGRVTGSSTVRGFDAAKVKVFARITETGTVRTLIVGEPPESVVTAAGTHSLIVTAAGTYAPTVAAAGTHDLIVEAEGAL